MYCYKFVKNNNPELQVWENIQYWLLNDGFIISSDTHFGNVFHRIS